MLPPKANDAGYKLHLLYHNIIQTYNAALHEFLALTCFLHHIAQDS